MAVESPSYDCSFVEDGQSRATLAIEGKVRRVIEARFAKIRPQNILMACWVYWRCQRAIQRRVERRAPFHALY